MAVADALSFRRAAALCHVSQPSLSTQVAEVETASGIQIFERSRRRVLVTPAGEGFVLRARRILREARDLENATLETSDPLSGRLRLGVIPTVAPYLLPFSTAPLRRAFPEFIAEWLEDKTEDLVEALDAGELDGAVLALEAEVGDVDYAIIAEDPFVLAAPKAHPLAEAGSALSARDLRGQDVLLLDDGHCFRDQALEVCGTARARELEFRATSLVTLVQMVAQGAGVTLLPALAEATEARHRTLVLRRFKAPAPSRTLAIVWRKGSPFGRAFEELAKPLRAAYQRAVKT